ncbi:MAG: peptidylprolyl isomerase [Ignavibacteriota bacterium]|nr:peptidylprolyl isomerase [Ignavibacteriota bacterium]
MTTKQKSTHGTGVMNKMRDSMPYIIVFLIIAFVGLIVFEWGMNYLGMRGGDRTVFGKVNGEEITYQEYEKMLQQQLENMRQQSGGKDVDDATLEQLKEQVWNSLVQQTLTKQEIARLGITVSDNEILEVIYKNPEQLPEAIKKNFMDSTGVFNADFYQQALGMKTKEATQFWNQVEAYMREVILSDKLQTYITASVIVTENDVLQKYKDDNIKASFKYAFLDVNSVTDTTQFLVSEEDMKSYFNEHKDEFKQEEAVKFKYVVFSDASTLDDTNSLKKQMEFLVKDVKNAKLEDSTLIKLVNDNSSAPFKADFQKPSQIGAAGKNALNFLFSSKPGETSGLLMDQDGFKILRLLEVKEGEDTYVNAAHILINFGTDTAAAKKQIEDILKRAKSGESFDKLAAELSQDPSAKQNSGDLGWFTKGAMVKEFEDAAMNGKVGDIVGPVKTQFGWHIIKIKDRSKKEFKFAEIKKPVTAGQRTKDIARKKAQEFLSDVESGAIIDSLAKNMMMPLLSTPEISKGGFVPGAGQNKNIIEFGLTNKKSKLYGPAKVQGGFAVYMITDKIAEGSKNYDSIKISLVKPKVAQIKKFAYLQKIAADLRSKITGGDILALQTLFPQVAFGTADSVSISKPDPKLGMDYPLYNAVFSMQSGEVSTPVKGTRGYYVAVLNWITPFDQNDYIVKQTDIRKQLLGTKKQQAVQEWMTNLTNNAKIEDHRDKYL